MAKFRTLLYSLPVTHYTLLEVLCALLHKLATKYHTITKMTSENLSIVIGPNIMRSRVSSTENSFDLQDTSLICLCCAEMIDNYSKLFKNDSVFDPDQVKGYTAPAKPLEIATSKPQPARGGRQRAVGTMLYNDSGMHRGHITKSAYEPRATSKQEMVFPFEDVRFMGESFATVIFDDDMFKVEREVPLEQVKSTIMTFSDDQHVLTILYTSKKVDTLVHISSTDEYALQEWKQKVDRCIVKMKQFVNIANAAPEKYGIIMTKEEFREAKKQKNEAMNNNSKGSTPTMQTPTTATPTVTTPTFIDAPTPILQEPVAPTITTTIQEPVAPADDDSTRTISEEEWQRLQDELNQARKNYESEMKQKKLLQQKVTDLEYEVTDLKENVELTRTNSDVQLIVSETEIFVEDVDVFESDSDDSVDFRQALVE